MDAEEFIKYSGYNEHYTINEDQLCRILEGFLKRNKKDNDKLIEELQEENNKLKTAYNKLLNEVKKSKKLSQKP
jgi:hypothetical protein